MERFFDRVAETKLYALEEPYEEKLLDFKTFHLRNFFGLLAKSFRPGCYCSTFPGKIFRYKHFFEEKHVVFEYLWKFFSVFGRNFSSRWSKLYFRCREEHFSWKNLLMKKLDFFSSSDVHLFSLILKVFFRQVLKISFLRVHENILSKNGFLRNFLFLVLGSWPSYFWSFSQKLFCKFGQNCIQSIQRNALIKLISFTKFWYVPSFFGIEWKIFWLLGEKLRHVSQICTSQSQLHFEESIFVELE